MEKNKKSFSIGFIMMCEESFLSPYNDVQQYYIIYPLKRGESFMSSYNDVWWSFLSSYNFVWRVFPTLTEKAHEMTCAKTRVFTHVLTCEMVCII